MSISPLPYTYRIEKHDSVKKGAVGERDSHFIAINRDLIPSATEMFLVFQTGTPAINDHMAVLAQRLNEAWFEGYNKCGADFGSQHGFAISREEAELILQRVDGDTAVASSLRLKVEQWLEHQDEEDVHDG